MPDNSQRNRNRLLFLKFIYKPGPEVAEFARASSSGVMCRCQDRCLFVPLSRRHSEVPNYKRKQTSLLGNWLFRMGWLANAWKRAPKYCTYYPGIELGTLASAEALCHFKTNFLLRFLLSGSRDRDSKMLVIRNTFDTMYLTHVACKWSIKTNNVMLRTNAFLPQMSHFSSLPEWFGLHVSRVLVSRVLGFMYCFLYCSWHRRRRCANRLFKCHLRSACRILPCTKKLCLSCQNGHSTCSSSSSSSCMLGRAIIIFCSRLCI